MTKRDVGSKLAATVRHARAGREKQPEYATTTLVEDPKPLQAATGTVVSDQSPPRSRDGSRKNLHPDRVWPD